MSSYDEFLRYAEPYKLIPTTSTTHPVNNETTNLYSEGATLSTFIHEGRPTTTKLTLVDLPSSIDHSTSHECSKGILCLVPTFHHSPLTRPVVIISYSLRLGRKNTLPSTSTIRWKTERESTPKRLIYSTSSVARPSKFVSNLPTSLSNRRKSYLYRLLRLHRNHLH